jgi:hypothetical protein
MEERNDVPMMAVSAHEYEVDRWFQLAKRLAMALTLCVLVLGGLVAYVIYDHSQWDYSTVTVDGRDDSMTTYIGANANNGDITNGSDSRQDEKKKE